MYRVLYFFAIIIIPVCLSWWLFVPMALLAVYLIKLPYEIVFVAFILDLAYYFGDGIIYKHLLLIFSVLLIVLALFLSKRIHWRRII